MVETPIINEELNVAKEIVALEVSKDEIKSHSEDISEKVNQFNEENSSGNSAQNMSAMIDQAIQGQEQQYKDRKKQEKEIQIYVENEVKQQVAEAKKRQTATLEEQERQFEVDNRGIAGERERTESNARIRENIERAKQDQAEGDGCCT